MGDTDEPTGRDDIESMRYTGQVSSRAPELEIDKALDDKRSKDIIDEMKWMMKVALYIEQMPVKVRTFPKGKPEDIERRGGTLITAEQLFDRMVVASLRDGKLHDLQRGDR